MTAPLQVSLYRKIHGGRWAGGSATMKKSRRDQATVAHFRTVVVRQYPEYKVGEHKDTNRSTWILK